jgi:hypothetical protein
VSFPYKISNLASSVVNTVMPEDRSVARLWYVCRPMAHRTTLSELFS